METVGDPRAVIEDLRERYRTQAQQLLLWRRRVKVQEELLARLARERAQQLQALSAQLLLFEARLCRKQKDIATLLAQRESVIARQQRTIRALQGRLADAGLDGPDSPPASNLDSLNDSDSAVIMEEGDHEAPAPGPRARVVVRSVSDALEQPKYPALRRSDGFLRRPEVLETVYSVEEDGEGEAAQSKSEMAAVEGDEATEDSGSGGGRLQGLYGSFERLNDTSTPPPQSQVMTTYNRVMSNHRSVTKPKDVKYKRINKAKSKSLEELRGRLRNWVDKGNKLAVSLDQSYA